MGYFNYFPNKLYSNNAVTNLIAKVKFDDSVSRNLGVFYPYTVRENERADIIAENYYGDAEYDWVVYLSNSIIDPIHEWPKDELSQRNFLTAKYTSISNAQLQIAFYRTNEESDESVISPAAFSALAGSMKQYWAPIIGRDNIILNYERKKMSMIVETNKTIIVNGSFSNIAVNSILKQSSSISGTVGFSNSSSLVLRHISGSWSTNTTTYFSLSNTIANATITSVTTISESIPNAELSYWNAVSYYEYENEENEKRKNIRLLGSSYIDLIDRDMRALLKS